MEKNNKSGKKSAEKELEVPIAPKAADSGFEEIEIIETGNFCTCTDSGGIKV
jgi:hypothetical protein